MKRIILYCGLALLLMGSIIGAGCAKPEPAPAPAPAPVQPIEWKLQSLTVPGATVWDGYMVPLADLIKEKTGGRLNITIHTPGAIVPSAEITKSVAEGIIEMGLTSPGYDAGVIPEGIIIVGLPFAQEDHYQQQDFWMTYKGGEAWKIATDAYMAKGVKPLAILCQKDPMVMMTLFPVSKVADFEGKKIRATGASSAPIKALGAEMVNLGLGDVYNGLQTGVLDGNFMAISGLKSFKWEEVVKYVVEPAWTPSGPLWLEVNPAALDGLPADLRKILIDTSDAAVKDILFPYSEKMNKVYVESATAAGVKWVTLTGAEADKYRNCAVGAWQYAESKSPEMAKLVQLLRDQCTELGIKYPGS